MKTRSYQIPKAYLVILKSLLNELKQFSIEQEAFLEYCLAVFLFARMEFYSRATSDKKKDLLEDNEVLDQLIRKNGYIVSEDIDGDAILVGLPRSYKADHKRLEVIEKFLNCFSSYQALKKKNYVNISDGESYYESICEKLKELRCEIRVPLRLEAKARAGSNNAAKGFTVNVDIDDKHDSFFDDVKDATIPAIDSSEDELSAIEGEHDSVEEDNDFDNEDTTSMEEIGLSENELLPPIDEHDSNNH